MPYNSIDEAIKDASMDQLVKAAKDKGYSPLKESEVIKQRDTIFSQKAKAENEASNLEGQLNVLKEENKTLKQKAGELDKIKEQHTDFEEQLKELESYRKEKQEKKKQAEKSLKERTAKWTAQDKDLADTIPDLGDPTKTLAWMDKMEKRLFPDGLGESSDTSGAPDTQTTGQPATEPSTPRTYNPPPKSQGGITDDIRKKAEDAGVSPEVYARTINNLRQKKKENHG